MDAPNLFLHFHCFETLSQKSQAAVGCLMGGQVAALNLVLLAGTVATNFHTVGD